MNKANVMANKFAANMQGQINAGMVEPVKKSKFEFKDVARIVQGILISKVFYTSLNSIRRATNAVWEFSKELEYARMVYSNLFGDVALAEEFINVLKDYSAITPFTFKQSEQAAKRLLAYGIEYKNIMYVMEGVLAAATVQGNDAIIEPISRALGQIYTKGRLMNEEMRQLAEAGIPVYEILQEKLGLSVEELRNLGRTAVPASEAINALIDGINERFGTTLDQAAYTTKGVLSNIKDNSEMFLSALFDPMAQSFKKTLIKVGNYYNELRAIIETKGIGGVFERIIPREFQEDVKHLIGLFKMFGNILKTFFGSALNSIKYMFISLMYILNAIGPVLAGVLGIVAALTKVLTSNEKAVRILSVMLLAAAAAWTAYKIKALSALVTTAVMKVLTKSVAMLVGALNVLVAHPVWALLALGIGVFVALTASSNKFRESISNMYKSLYSMAGIDTAKMLLPESKERASDVGKFNKALDGTSKSMDDLAKNTGAAAKAAKSLLSFDEVFTLKAPDEGNAAADLDNLLDAIAAFEGVDFTDIEMPDVTGIATDFITNLIDALNLQEKALAIALGSLLFGALGTAIGGPLLGKLGLIIGGFAGYFWDDIAKYLGLNEYGKLAIPIGAGIGGAIGLIMGGPAGAAIGTAIGAFVGLMIDRLITAFEEKDWSSIATIISVGLGGAIGFIIGGPAGAALGIGIGLLVGWVSDKVLKAFKTNDWSEVGTILGVGLGTALGFLVGGPAGAVIGAGIGFLVDYVTKQIETGFKTGDWTTVAMPLGLGLGAAIGFLVGGPAGAVIGAGVGALIGFVVEKLTQNWSKIKEFIATKFSEARIAVSDKITEIKLSISTKFEEIKTSITTKLDDIRTTIREKLTTWSGFFKLTFDLIHFILSFKLQDIWMTAKRGLANLYTSFKTWKDDMWANVFEGFFKWLDDGIKKLKEFFGLEEKTGGVGSRTTSTTPTGRTSGGSTNFLPTKQLMHAQGGIFNREHIARFAEGNKPEAIIPLDNKSAMQPFVDAVADGLTAVLMPMMSTLNGQQNQLRPVYVGTLIADERSLKELNRKMNIIQLEENVRMG